jgi:hypothetical protein
LYLTYLAMQKLGLRSFDPQDAVQPLQEISYG